MDLEGVMLSEINQAEKIDNTWFHLYLKSKNNINKTAVDS